MDMNIMFDHFPVLESEELILGKIEEKHLQDLFRLYDNDKVFEYCGIIPKHNIQTVSKMIGHFERDYQKRSRIKWGIFQKKDSQKLLGIIECMDFNQKVNSVTIGYYLAEECWGNGIATKSVQLIVKYLFGEVNLNRIHAEVMPANEVSKKVLNKNGFIREGLLRQATLWSGKGIVDLEIYSLLKEDYVE
ncbi:GNAT family protein [Psychrobacillus sp. PGGUH221]|uniref:GNAT family N-acetyltransferase n=1 Tax=Psychrobacillus sp. PGGUH221 TaxID=3020058 RepID=UPI0035C6B0D9